MNSIRLYLGKWEDIKSVIKMTLHEWSQYIIEVIVMIDK